ncbi:MAG TPA: phosphate ABC transporter permease subunit PstC [Actinomycetes bacterium]|nr:phosphate ABC transporter permease subunit PstC [Actinomycetes bacterium]
MSTLSVNKRAAAAGTPGFLRQQRPRYGEKIVFVILLSAALVSVATTIGIVFSLFVPAAEFFNVVPIGEFLTGTDWSPTFANPSFGVIPLVVGTLLTTLIASIVALPLGLGSAIYLSEYASDRLRRMLKPALEVLAGIPTVIYGFFALTLVTPFLRWVIPGGGDVPSIFNTLSAGLVMGVMIIPTVASLSEDAMSAVPNGLRQGAFALGSNQRQVSTRVVVPAALSGISAAFILGISRAIGETMIVTIAGGGIPNTSWNPLDPHQTMTAFIAATAGGDIATGTTIYKTIFAVGALLFLFTFVMNMLSIRLVRKYREVYE